TKTIAERRLFPLSCWVFRDFRGPPLSVLSLFLQIAASVAVTALALRWDTKRLEPERYARSWNVASFWSAVVAFGPLCIPVHFARTRRTALGFLLGII